MRIGAASEPSTEAPSPRRARRLLILRLAAVSLLVGACVAFAVALPLAGLSCTNTDDAGLDDCRRAGRAQLVLAAAGLGPAAALVAAAARASRRLALVALAVGLPVHAAWATVVARMLG